MTLNRQPELQRAQKAPEPAPVTAPAPKTNAPQPPQGTAPAVPLARDAILNKIKAKLPTYDEGADILAGRLATEKVTDPVLQSRLGNVPALYADMIAAWRGGGGAKDGDFVRAFGSKDPIAVQKFADVDAEAYIEGGKKQAVTQDFYAKIAIAIQTAQTDRTRVFPLLQTASKSFTFLGAKIPAEALTPLTTRNHGVGSLYSYSLSADGSKELNSFALAEVAKKTGATPEELAAQGLAPTAKQRKEALRFLLRTRHAGNPLFFADKSKSLARAETWFSPDEVQLKTADANTGFTDLMTANALQPEWYPEGALALTIRPTGLRDARKPTAFDGMMSALWMARNQPAQTYGVTGGGAREFLEKGMTFGMVERATAVIPSESWVAELSELAKSVRRDSSAGEETLRGNKVAVHNTQAAFDSVIGRSMQEASTPSLVPGQRAPGGPAPIAAGGTFDARRAGAPVPAHARAVMDGKLPAGSPAAPAAPPPGANKPGAEPPPAAANPGSGRKGAGGAT